MSFMMAAEITGVVLAACRGFGPEVSIEFCQTMSTVLIHEHVSIDSWTCKH